MSPSPTLFLADNRIDNKAVGVCCILKLYRERKAVCDENIKKVFIVECLVGKKVYRGVVYVSEIFDRSIYSIVNETFVVRFYLISLGLFSNILITLYSFLFIPVDTL